MKISKNWLLVACVVASAVVLVGTRVLADNAYDLESFTSSNNVVTLDGTGDGGNNAAVIDWILSEPGNFQGGLFSSWSFLVSDASGSMLVFCSTGNVSSFGYTPTVGDIVTVTANYSPYHAIPELSSLYSPGISKLGTTNAFVTAGVHSPANGWYNPQQELIGDGKVKVATIPQVLANPAVGATDGYGVKNPSNGQASLPLSQSLAGYMVEIQNVTIGSAGTLNGIFPSGNWTFSITDSSGNSMTMYYWTTSYSMDREMSGGPIPDYPVDVYGFLSAYPSKLTTTLGGTNMWQDEITPIGFIQEIPEPSSFMLAGVGLLSLIAVIRRRRS